MPNEYIQPRGYPSGLADDNITNVKTHKTDNNFMFIDDDLTLSFVTSGVSELFLSTGSSNLKEVFIYLYIL